MNQHTKITIEAHYFGNISYYHLLANASHVSFEVYENYRKQSYKNRTVICGANGPLNLCIPLIRREGRTPINRVEIDHSQRWKTLHWKSLEAAYRSSAYFEYYESHFHKIFELDEQYLLNWNMKTIQKCLSLLDIQIEQNETKVYQKTLEDSKQDYRNLIHPKNNEGMHTYVDFPAYFQVFSNRLPFYPDLSILDLLFNLGPQSKNYLANLPKLSNLAK